MYQLTKPRKLNNMKVETVTISLTNQCNYRCPHCSVNGGEKCSDELNLNEIENLLNQLKKIGVKKIELSGGEPLLRKDIFEIVSLAKRLHFQVKILTNGSLLSKEKIDLLKKMGLDGLGISLDGATYEVYKYLRPVTENSFKRVLRNIRIASLSGMFTKINTVGVNANLNDIQNIINLCEKYQVQECRICYLSKRGRGKKLNGEVEPLLWLKTLKKLRVKTTKLYLGVPYAKFHGRCLLKERIPLFITSNGYVYSCLLQEKAVGNIRQNIIKNLIKKIKLKSCLPLKKYYDLNPICPLRKISINKLNENKNFLSKIKKWAILNPSHL